MQRIEVLYRLQTLDLQLEETKRGLREIEAQLGENAALTAARDAVGEAERLIGNSEAEMREREWEVTRLDQKIKEFNDRLFSGKVTNPKELASIQKEVEHLGRLKAQQEDQELDLMARLEEQRAELARLKQRYSELEAAVAEERKDLLASKSRLEEDLARQLEERERLVRAANPADIPVYDRLRSQRAGRAVARVDRSLCEGCRVFLPTHLVQKARTSPAPVFCSSCGRILYAGR